MKGRKPSLFLKLGQFPFSWTQIRIPNTDLDSRTVKSMMIHADPDPHYGVKVLIELANNSYRTVVIKGDFFWIFCFLYTVRYLRYSTLLHLPPDSTVSEDALIEPRTPCCDPNPNPPDPYVFGPPGYGSGSTSRWIRIRIFLTSSKNRKKEIDSCCFETSF